MFMTLSRPADLPARWAPALPFAAAGAVCTVAGGLVAAATAPVASELGSWAAAYLVLVAGVAQVALGGGQAVLAPAAPAGRAVGAELIGWNAGNGAVLAGTLLGRTWLADLGGALLVVALALVAWQLRGAARRPAWPLHAYRALVALVLVSIPVGLVIGHFRPG
jgi:hypothetical protein